MKLHTSEALGIYYINGMLSAEVLHHGKITATWEHPLPVIEEEELEQLLLTIPEQMKFGGYKASMIIAAPPIEYHILPVPAMNKNDLHKYCKWKAETLKGKNHLWSYTRLKTSHQKATICLHLIPSVYQSIFIRFCRKAKLEPQHLLTIPAVVSGLLEKLDDSDGTVEMVALVTDRVTYFVLGTKNAPIFIREVTFSWNTADSNEILQFGREIKRTSLFIKRQFDKEIGVLRIRGTNADKAKNALIEAGVIDAQFDETPVHLFESISATSIYRSDNLLPFEMLGSRTRVLRTLSLSVVSICFCGALLLATLFVNNTLNKEQLSIDACSLRSDLALVRDSLDYLTTSLSSIEGINHTFDYIKKQTASPLIGYFVSFCADILPDDLVISRIALSTVKPGQIFAVEIEGICPADPTVSAALLDQFEKKLVMYPVQMQIIESWHLQWLTNLHDGGGNEEDPYSRRFRITGRLQ